MDFKALDKYAATCIKEPGCSFESNTWGHRMRKLRMTAIASTLKPLRKIIDDLDDDDSDLNAFVKAQIETNVDARTIVAHTFGNIPCNFVELDEWKEFKKAMEAREIECSLDHFVHSSTTVLSLRW
jgi:hypothetical protein